MVLDIGPRRFHQPPVLHAGRAGALAAAAGQAQIDVFAYESLIGAPSATCTI